MRRRGRAFRVAVPLAAAGVAVAALLVALPLLSGPDLTPGRTTPTVPAGTPVSSAQELLAIAEATGADNCRITDVAFLGSAYSVNCSPAGEGLFNVNFMAFADGDALDRNAPTSGVFGIPGEDEDCSSGQSFTGTWEQDDRGGVLACVMGGGASSLVWTENSRLLLVGFLAVDPDQKASDDQLDAAYEWWQDNATLD